MPETKSPSNSPPDQPRLIEMPKFSYQPIDSRAYSVDYQEPRKVDGDRVVSSLRNLHV